MINFIPTVLTNYWFIINFTSGEGDLRLVSSFSDRGGIGRLEIFLQGEWGTLCDEFLADIITADVACRQLGYDSANGVGFANGNNE